MAMALVRIGQRRPDLVSKYIMERATELSVAVTMKILDRERIAHCRLCPSRFSLRKVGNGYACPQHTQEVKAAAA
jgi:hypothetical protein